MPPFAPLTIKTRLRLPYKDEVEVAVADLADGPVPRRAAQPSGNLGKRGQVIAEIGFLQDSILMRAEIAGRSML
jgi:hypothetical protein